MTFGRITVSISDEQIITITDISDMSQFDNLVVTISVERAKDVKFCFYDDGRCELRDLIKSLTVLDSRYRGFDKTEYLCLDKLKDFEHDYDAFYLNLSNGVLYCTGKENSVSFICRPTNGTYKYALPLYDCNKFFYFDGKQPITYHSGLDLMGVTALGENYIKKLTFTLKTA